MQLELKTSAVNGLQMSGFFYFSVRLRLEVYCVNCVVPLCLYSLVRLVSVVNLQLCIIFFVFVLRNFGKYVRVCIKIKRQETA